MLISTFQTNDDNVASFNGRKGDVTPQSGDYTADQVGAAPARPCLKNAINSSK